MKFFCVKNYPTANKSLFEDAVKIILQMPPEEREDDDHNKIFQYFHHDIYLNTIGKNRSMARLLLCMTILQGMKIQRNQNITDTIKDFQYLFVMEGQLDADKNTYKVTSNFTFKQLQAFNVLRAGKNGCFLAYLSQSRYRQLLEYPYDYIKQKADDLSQFSLFHDFTQTHLLYLSSKIISQKFRFRQIVYKFGQQSDYVYCIRKGSFEMIRRFKQKMANYESSISSIQNGQTFGQDCIFLKCTRETQIRSLGCDNIIYKIPANCLVEVYDQYPKLKTELIVNIHERRAVIQQKCIQNAALHQGYKKRARQQNSSTHSQSMVLPKVREHYFNKQISITRIIKQKTNQEVGLELFAKAFNLNQHKLLKPQKIVQRNSKKDILRSLGSRYLLNKFSQDLKENRQLLKSSSEFQNIFLTSPQKQNLYQFPMIDKGKGRQKKDDRKYPRFRSKPKSLHRSKVESSSDLCFSGILEIRV